MTLVDLHCHILPGVDDGAKDLPMALGMARDAVAQGISHILLTPHHMDGEYTNHKIDVLRKTTAFQEALDAAKIPPVNGLSRTRGALDGGVPKGTR